MTYELVVSGCNVRAEVQEAFFRIQSCVVCWRGWLETGKFKRTRTYEKNSGNSAVMREEVRVFPAVVI